MRGVRSVVGGRGKLVHGAFPFQPRVLVYARSPEANRVGAGERTALQLATLPVSSRTLNRNPPTPSLGSLAPPPLVVTTAAAANSSTTRGDIQLFRQVNHTPPPRSAASQLPRCTPYPKVIKPAQIPGRQPVSQQQQQQQLLPPPPTTPCIPSVAFAGRPDIGASRLVDASVVHIPHQQHSLPRHPPLHILA